MSKHSVDHLIKNKLEDISVLPSPQAWNKLESKLPGRKKWFQYRYLKIAAGISGVIVVAYLLWNLGYQTALKNNQLTVTDNTVQESVIPQKSNTDNNSKIESFSAKNLPDQNEDQVNDGKIVNNELVQFTATLTRLEEIPLSGISLPQNIQVVPVPRKEQQVVAHLDLNASDEVVLPKVVITYKPGPEKSDKSLKRIWNYAVDVKNGEEKLPSLRKIKNDLLAFNLKKKKKEDKGQ